jgi:hypothetical protein
MAPENGKRLTFVYTTLGIIISVAVIVGGFWTAYARPKVCEQSRIEIRDWWDQSGTFKVEKIADAICEKKIAVMDKKLDAIYQMNLRRLNRTERREFELPEDTINP